MTFHEEIAALQARLAKAQSDRDTWRTSGMQERYLEAYSRVEALELQLERLRQEGLKSFARAPEPASVCALLSSKPRADAAAAVPEASGERGMPDEAQRRLMAAFAITFEDGVYHLGPYRYDRLADAVNYARLQQAT